MSNPKPANDQRYPAALRSMRRRFATSNEIYVRMRVADVPDISRELGDALCRVAGLSMLESLRARAETVSLSLTETEKGVTLRVRDDGTGIDHRLQEAAFFKRLRLIRANISELGGKVKVRDAAPRGVVLEVAFPAVEKVNAVAS